MNKNNLIGIAIGAISGVIDIVPMLIQKLPWNANLSAFSLWVVVGFLLSIIDLKVKSWLKGIIIAFLVLIPNLFIIGWAEPVSLIPICLMTTILGGLCGWSYQKAIN